MVNLPDSARRVRALRPGDDAPREWYRIVNAADSDTGAAEILIYDEIDPFWGISANQFVRDLAGITADAITVRINSPGGDVYEGIAILNALRTADATVTTVVDGIAASAASFIAMAGEEIIMMPNSELMIHDPWALMIGNSKDMQATADNLNRIGDNIASIYAARAGGTTEEWRAVMTAETWYSAQEAVDSGLATRVEEIAPADAKATASVRPRNGFDLSIFNYAGRTHAPAPQSPTATAEAEVTQREKEGTMPTLMEGLAERLGIPADADDDTALQAIDEALAERATEAPEVTPPAEATPEQLTAAAAKMGLSLIDKAALDNLTAQASAGQDARNEQVRAERESYVDNAIREGRFAPAARDAWLASYEKNPEGTRKIVETLPKNTVPISEMGHGIGTDAPDTDPYTALYGQEA